MNTKRFSPLLLILSTLLAAQAAFAEDTIQIGVLTCKSIVGSRVNLIFRSTTDVYCEFKHSDGQVEHYLGETGIAFGADLTFAKEEEIFAFAVLSASDVDVGSHTLAGRYVGGKASASLGVGIGAAMLVGGSRDNFALNPLALEGNKGFGASAGIGFLNIEKSR
jgi:hypothetical protein